jgi:hypothetical protein
VTYDYDKELRSLSYLHNLFRSTSRAILEDSQFPLVTKIRNNVQRQHHCRDPLPPNGHCQADEMGREALPGSTSGTRQVLPEVPGGEDGGRLGNLAMEAEKASICSFFQVAFTPSPSSPSCRGRPRCSLTCPGCRQVCGFSCSSECHQSSPKAWAHRCASAGHPQRHQVPIKQPEQSEGPPGEEQDGLVLPQAG